MRIFVRLGLLLVPLLVTACVTTGTKNLANPKNLVDFENACARPLANEPGSLEGRYIGVIDGYILNMVAPSYIEYFQRTREVRIEEVTPDGSIKGLWFVYNSAQRYPLRGEKRGEKVFLSVTEINSRGGIYPQELSLTYIRGRLVGTVVTGHRSADVQWHGSAKFCKVS